MSAATAINIPVKKGVAQRVAIIAGVIALAIAAFIWLVMPSTQSSELATKAPSFTLPSVSGSQEVSLSMREGKPAVINFFASWCVPCRRELPHLASASKEYENITFIGVDNQDSRSQARDLLAASGVTYATGYDPDGKVAPKYGVTTGLPSTVFINAEGRIVHTQYGEITEQDLNNQLRLLDSANE